MIEAEMLNYDGEASDALFFIKDKIAMLDSAEKVKGEPTSKLAT